MKKPSAKKSYEEAKNNYLAAVYTKKTDIVNKWDAVDVNNRKKRRMPRIELAEEQGTTGQLPPLERLKAINLCRDLQRNYTAAKANLLQIRLNVAGNGPKLIINHDDDSARAAEHYFNFVWSKDCDYRDDTPFGESVGIAAMALHREADFLVCFDNFIDDTGKLIFFEADQMANIDQKDWKDSVKNPDYPADKFENEDGVIFEKKMGKIVAYAVAAKRGKAVYKIGEVTIFKKESASVRLIKMPWRFNQRRGTPEMLTAAGHYEDAYEILASELQTAKVASKYGIVITRKDNDHFETVLDNNFDPTGVLEGDDSISTKPDDIEGSKAGVAPQLYERMEALAGGYLNYLEEGDDIKVLDFNRPSTNIKEYLDYISVQSGVSMGLFSCYSTGKVTTSYTAFRGEQILSRPTFEFVQNLLQIRFCEWAAINAIEWGLAHGKLSTIPDNWKDAITFQWPKMREVNEVNAANANEIKLKSGQTDFIEILGPQWRKKLEGFAVQLDVARKLNIPLSMFENILPVVDANKSKDNADNNSNDDETKKQAD